ncbi:Spy/CpxP family protein refolding chaperone [Spirosoma utsteinense]|uniref:Spy/CpxP family protein refolding chaperone n=1 Tax=Spirosoma utsteinense TaxID=2585773 RepID=A0ABR6W290_9BACT|nr:Spy/CpxP family protein refolding chaperone [Spirosoma utsteinense]MBC3790635.1 Spy/CpxP family protein refolding chaperone [Spirosoma utsteinense]
MKHVWIGWLIVLTLTAHAARAQNDVNGRQKIESAKIGMITNRLNLTTDQAPQFWAIYNEYNGKKQELNRRVRQLNNESPRSNVNDDQLLNGLREVNATKQKLADLDNEYMSRFLKVITPAQLAELYKTEQVFNKMLLQRLNNQNK